MSTITAKEVVVTWDGDPATWPDYSRKVRLQWEKTQPHKRRHLGPDLASRLTGRAWGVTADLNHRLLAKKNGTKYLLRVLRDRLCRTAVPDAGARLEDLLIRLRRPLGMTMSQWSNEVMETYRKVQRALMRAQQQQRERSPKKDRKKTESMSAQSEPQAEPPSPTRSPTGRSPPPELLLNLMPKLKDPKEKDMFLSPKLILMKNTVNGLMRSGSNGTRRNAKSGKRTPHHQARICLGMSWRSLNSRSCRTRSWDGSC
jgi:hypothetical protein